MLKLPPGLVFIATLLAVVAGYLCITAGVLHLLAQYLGVALSVKLNIFIATILCSGYVAARINTKFWSQSREADRLGSKLIPVVRGRWPGNVDVTMALAKSIEEDYVGTCSYSPLKK